MARQNLRLDLRLLGTKVDNEARVRAAAESRGEFNPPFDLPLNARRDELREKMASLDRAPLSEDPKWLALRDELTAYLKLTENPRKYR